MTSIHWGGLDGGRHIARSSIRSASGRLSNVFVLGAYRILLEVKTYFRAPDQIGFTFLFPLTMLFVFSVAYSRQGDIGAVAGQGGVSVASYYLPAMIAAGIFLSGVQNLAIDIAKERSDGTLKRLGGCPLPRGSYFIGKAGQVLITSTLQLVLLLAFARLALGVQLPTDPHSWLTFAWLYLLGIASSSVLGVALSSLPRSGRSASAVVIPITVVLQFISGVYVQFNVLPSWLQHVAAMFPLKWIAQGMRSVFLPAHFDYLESGHDWDLGGTALALAIWFAIGLAVSCLTFRWVQRKP